MKKQNARGGSKRAAPHAEDGVELDALTTEQANPRTAGLDGLDSLGIARSINREDRTVADAVARALPQIAKVIDAVAERLGAGGRLIYIGAGTSGRLGCLDASEMPPTYGVPARMVQGIIAGGRTALTRSIEGAEDDGEAGRREIAKKRAGPGDAVVGLSASGRAAFVREALAEARKRGAFTACVTCNANSPLREFADVAIVAETGAEAVAGSTRMKAGTAQKMILNMISTGAMVRIGRVSGNRMVDMQIKCRKLQERAERMVAETAGVSKSEAARALASCDGSTRKAIELLKK